MPLILKILCMIIPAWAAAFASPSKLFFEHITPDMGLSQSDVHAIHQDQRGFLWFGAQSGLNRFDGHTFTVFKHDPEDPRSLSNNYIQAIHETSDGSLWVGVTNGLNRLQLGAPGFERWSQESGPRGLSHGQIKVITSDEDGYIWAGGLNALNRVNPNTGEVTQYTLADDPNLICNGILSDGVFLWIASNQGLIRFDIRDGSTKWWRKKTTDSFGLQSNLLNAIIFDGQKNIMLATGKGLQRFNPESGAFESWLHDPANGESISPGPIYSLHMGHDQSIWAGSAGHGLNRMNPDGSFTRFKSNTFDPHSLRSPFIISIFQDRSGVLWVAVGGKGLAYADLTAVRFQTYRHISNNPNSLSRNEVSAIIKDKKGDLWVGTWFAGLNHIQRKTGKVTRFPNQKKGDLPGSTILALFEGKGAERGRIWVSTDKGVFLFSRTEGVVQSWPRPVNAIGGARSLFQEENGVMWVGTSLGLYKLERGSNKYLPLDLPQDHPLTQGDIRTIAPDGEGSLWIAVHSTGILHYNPTTQETRTFQTNQSEARQFNTGQILTLHVDRFSPKTVWAGTYGVGLIRLDAKTGEIVSYTEQNSGLSTNEICSVMQDDMGRLWISTIRGLNLFDPKTKIFRNFDIGDGIQGTEFSSGSFFRAQDGEMFLGGSEGLNYFFPNRLKDNPFAPEVQITDLKVHGKSLPVLPDSPLERPLHQTNTIRLGWRQNDVAFEFVGLHFSRPSKNSHTYMLENFDSEWQQAGAERVARYTNLDPGAYRFLIKASNSDGVTTEEPAYVTVIIDPPWWRTPWAYTLYVVSFILFILLIDRLQKERFLQKERRRVEIERARLRAEAAESHAKAAEAQARAIDMERLMLESENARKSRELEDARTLQLSLLPTKLPDLPNLEVAVHMSTATEVGGDYYDFKLCSQETLTLAIGDATGHGLRAGAMVTATKSLFNTITSEDSPSQFLSKASRSLSRMGFRQMYMALMVGHLRGRQLTLASAGMPYAVIHRAAQNRVEEVVIKGIPLGSPAEFPYQDHSIELQSGDTLLLQSDGCQERFNPENQMLGAAQLESWMMEAVHLGPQELINSLVEKSETWAHPRDQDDDITFVALRIQ